MRQIVPVLVALVVSACAGTDAHMRMLESDGAFAIAPGAAAGEYVVTLRNVRDFGYDPDDPAQRQATAARALEAQCGRPGRVVGETIINTGTYALGQPARTYAVRVVCG